MLKLYLFVDLVVVSFPYKSLNFMWAGTIFILLTIVDPILDTEPAWHMLNKYLLNE